MVTKERKLVTIDTVDSILQKYNCQERDDVMEDLKNLPTRQPKPEPPDGGISLRSASRKYGIPHPTLSRWVKKGYVPILLRTRNELYVNDALLSQLIKRYRQNPGQGKNTIQ